MSTLTLNLHGEPLSLRDTLDCGQAFRWRENNDGSFSGVVHGGLVSVSLADDYLKITTPGNEVPDRDYWENYFALDVDYKVLQRLYSTDETLAKCVAFAPGIRVLRQDFFETLVSFIISQNNNIPRIKKIIEGLCDSFGENVGTGPDGVVRHAFPTSAKIASLLPEDLSSLRAGYRVPYILAAGHEVNDGNLDLALLNAMPTADLRKKVLGVHGVGPKVADCVLLFGLGRFESFPVDVWIRRAMAALFPKGLPGFAVETAGIAQQYIFNYARGSKLIFE